MRKFLRVLFWLALVGGLLEIILSIAITGGYGFIYIGIIIGVIGFLGCVFTYIKPSELLWDLIELVLDIVSDVF